MIDNEQCLLCKSDLSMLIVYNFGIPGVQVAEGRATIPSLSDGLPTTIQDASQPRVHGSQHLPLLGLYWRSNLSVVSSTEDDEFGNGIYLSYVRKYG